MIPDKNENVDPRVVYAIIQKSPLQFVRQGYCLKSELADQTAEPGQTVMELPRVINPADFTVVDTLDGYALEPLPACIYVPGKAEADENMRLTLSVPAGTQIVYGNQTLKEEGGKITIQFTREGPSNYLVRVPGYLAQTFTINALSFESAKAELKQEANQTRDEKLVEPFDIGGGLMLDGSEKSQTSIMAAAFLALSAKVAGTSYSMEWVDAHNQIITLDRDQILRAAELMAKRRSDLFVTARREKDRIGAAKTVKEARSSKAKGIAAKLR